MTNKTKQELEQDYKECCNLIRNAGTIKIRDIADRMATRIKEQLEDLE